LGYVCKKNSMITIIIQVSNAGLTVPGNEETIAYEAWPTMKNCPLAVNESFVYYQVLLSFSWRFLGLWNQHKIMLLCTTLCLIPLKLDMTRLDTIAFCSMLYNFHSGGTRIR
jgi:hypothetical protein